ncbi:FAD-binding protein [Streptomyces sp. NPDC006197]|uniref:FAD-binding oxidoreductase n=1 Tax=Streptomyces sp. NPDC006197 TaxID=3156685 RepID=UPI0033BA77D9
MYAGDIDRKPAVILRPGNADQVAAVVALARETGLELAVRGGGHSPAGHSVCEGGIVLDLSRKYGMTIDDVLAAEIVTADGELLLVDEHHHPDLFWALRGGGNFGVVTRFEFRLHRFDGVYGGMMVLPVTPEILEAFVAEADLHTGWVGEVRPGQSVPLQPRHPARGLMSPAAG